MNIKKTIKDHPLVTFCFIYFLVWSLLPLLRQALPMDTIEAVGWGENCTLGTNKHPPLSGWLAYFFYDIIGFQTSYSLYALSQLCVMLGFFYIYRLSKEFVSKEKAMYSVMILAGTIYYGFSAIEYNVNVLSLALWPMTAFYFYKSLKNNHLADWALTGLFSGLNLFNKYTSAVLLLSMGLLMLSSSENRSKLKTFKPYICLLVCVLTILPHLLWWQAHDFFTLSYFIGRGSTASFENWPILRHIVYPLKFFFAQVLFVLGSVLIYVCAVYKEKKLTCRADHFQKTFLFYMGILPFLVMVAISAVLGAKLKSMWGFPCFYLLGLMFFVFFPYKMTENLRRKLKIGAYILLVILVVGQGCVILFNKSDKFHLNQKEFAFQMEQLWGHNAPRKPFKYVAGDVWWAYNVSLFAPSKPKPMIWADPNQNPWLDRNDFKKSGALILTSDKGEYQRIRERLGFVSRARECEVVAKNRIGKIKKKTIYCGIYRGFGEE